MSGRSCSWPSSLTRTLPSSSHSKKSARLAKAIFAVATRTAPRRTPASAAFRAPSLRSRVECAGYRAIVWAADRSWRVTCLAVASLQRHACEGSDLRHSRTKARSLAFKAGQGCPFYFVRLFCDDFGFDPQGVSFHVPTSGAVISDVQTRRDCNMKLCRRCVSRRLPQCVIEVRIYRVDNFGCVVTHFAFQQSPADQRVNFCFT